MNDSSGIVVIVSSPSLQRCDIHSFLFGVVVVPPESSICIVMLCVCVAAIFVLLCFGCFYRILFGVSTCTVMLAAVMYWPLIVNVYWHSIQRWHIAIVCRRVYIIHTQQMNISSYVAISLISPGFARIRALRERRQIVNDVIELRGGTAIKGEAQPLTSIPFSLESEKRMRQELESTQYD